MSNLKYLFIGLMIAGCSHGSSDSGAGPLVPMGKIRAQSERALTGQTAIFEASRPANQPQGAMGDLLMAEMAKSAKAQTASSDAKAESSTKTQQLRDAMKKGACVMDYGQPEAQQSPALQGVAQQFPKMKLKISGPSCPVEISFTVATEGKDGKQPCADADDGQFDCHFKTKMQMEYKVFDEGLQTKLEVKSGHVNLVFDIDQKMKAPQGEQDSQAFAFSQDYGQKSNFDLKAVDLKDEVYLISGNDTAVMKMAFSGSAGQQTIPQIKGGVQEDLQLSDQANGTQTVLSATLSADGASQPTERYSVNGQTVSKDEYMAEREKFANSMMQPNLQGQQNPPQTGSPTTQPTEPQPIQPVQPVQPVQPTQPVQPVQPVQPTQPVQPVQPWPGVPADHKVACTVESYSDHGVYIGYGSVEFVARSHAQQACQSTSSSGCSSIVNCQQQNADPAAYYCQEKTYSETQIFSATGASIVEAKYFARKDCLAKVAQPSDCATIDDSDCAAQ